MLKAFEQFLLRFENMFNVYIKKVKNPNSLININSFDNTFFYPTQPSSVLQAHTGQPSTSVCPWGQYMSHMTPAHTLGVPVETGASVVVVCSTYYKIKNYVLLCNHLDD